MKRKSKMLVTKTASIVADEFVKYEGKHPQMVGMVSGSMAGTANGVKYSVHNMLDKMFPKELKKELRTIGGDRSGVVFASGASEWAGAALLTPPLEADYHYFAPFLGLINIVAGKFANEIGFTGYISSDATSCISSYKGIQEAKWLIESGQLDRVLVVGIDDQVNASVMRVFGMTKASMSLEDEAVRKPSAFDSTNGGFRVSQGGGFVLLEKEESIYPAIAEVVSVAIGAEVCNNPIGMTITGAGYKSVISRCMKAYENPTFIKTHGTGTKANNEGERAAIQGFFGDNFIATGYKSEIGHTMGASGVVELSIAISDARKGLIRGIVNRTETDDKFLSYDKHCAVTSILLLGAGMGNVYAAVLLKLKGI